MKKLTEIKREDIIQAAKDEFRENGFAATSMDRIAQTANVSKRTVYNHFESKEALFEAIAYELCDVFSRVSDHAYDPVKPVRKELEIIGGHLMDLLCSDRYLRAFKLMVAETLNSPALTNSVIDDFQETDIGLVKWITAAAEDGKLDIKDPVMAGKQFLALLEAFTSWPYLFGVDHMDEDFDRQTVLNSAVDMFLGHYDVE